VKGKVFPHSAQVISMSGMSLVLHEVELRRSTFFALGALQIQVVPSPSALVQSGRHPEA
jgi:hypothetical protein